MKSKSETFSVTTGISVTAERGNNTYLHNNFQFAVDSFVHDEYPNS